MSEKKSSGRKKPAAARASGPGKQGALKYLVCIGASAGGLQALRSVLPNLPKGQGFAFVVIMHHDPSKPSSLDTLLTNYTSLSITKLDDGKKPEPDTIYIPPGGGNVVLEEGVWRIRSFPENPGARPSIDIFMDSLAQEMGERAVGVLLSGTGRDGTEGIRHIKAAGGLTVVQDPGTAAYPSMPRSALEAGVIDLSLSPDKIGEYLKKIGQNLTQLPRIPDPESGIDPLFGITKILLEHKGTDFSQYKRTTLARRVSRRMGMLEISDIDEYISILRASTIEKEHLRSDFLISMTEFFRDTKAFKALGSVLKTVGQSKKPGESFRVWLPGVATGEEAYSLAILIMESFGERLQKLNVQIYATDLDEKAIDRARTGYFPITAMAQMDKKLLDRYFRRMDDTFQVIKPIREMITFAVHDLTGAPPFSHLDLISCRNLLIYFNKELQEEVLHLFNYVLNPGGHLFLGKSEAVNHMSGLFQPVNKTWRIYRKPEDAGRGRPPKLPLFRAAVPGDQAALTRKSTKSDTLRDVMNQAIVDGFGPIKAVMVDDLMDVQYIQGDINPFLTLGAGKAGLNIMNLASGKTAMYMTSLLHRFRTKPEPMESPILKVSYKDEEIRFRIKVMPVTPVPKHASLTLILFQEEPDRSPVPVTGKKESKKFTARELDDRGELEKELAIARLNLQSSFEEMEASNEELQSMTEEFQSTNEELQSTNEELESANEELQSTNEELNSVNEELAGKQVELAHAYSDLENVFRNLGLGTVMVDQDLRITRYNRPAGLIFHLGDADTGRVLTSINTHIKIPHLRQDLLHVLDSGEEMQRQIRGQNRTYKMRVIPYIFESDKIKGVILMFQDVTDILKVEKKLGEQNSALRKIHDTLELSEKHYHDLFQTAPISYILTDSKDKITGVNSTCERVFGMKREKFIGRPLSEFIHEAAGRSRSQGKDQGDMVHASHEAVTAIRTEGKSQYFIMDRSAVSGLDGKVLNHRIALIDITELEKIREQFRKTDALFSSIFSASPDAITITTLDEGRYIEVNDAFTKLIGFTKKEVFGKTTIDLRVYSDPAERRELVKTLRRERMTMKDMHVRTKDGEERMMMVIAQKVDIEGQQFILAILKDITRIKALERSLETTNKELERRNRDLESFVHTAAHDLRTPLISTVGFFVLLKKVLKDNVDPNIQNIMDRISEQLNRYDHLLRDLLDFAQIGIAEMKRDTVDVGELILSIMEESERAMGQKAETLSIQEDLPRVHMSESRVYQVFANLASNSIKFRREGVPLKISVGIAEGPPAKEVPAGHRVFYFKDNGTGIDPRFHDTIFDLFSRASVGQGDDGTGVGLSIVTRIVETEGGWIEVESKPGRGATFFFALPVIQKPHGITSQRPVKRQV